MDTNADPGGIVLWGQQSHAGKQFYQEDRSEVREFQTADGRTATLALVVAEIGDRGSGETASEMAKNKISAQLLSNPPAASEITSRLKEVLEETGQAIYDASLGAPERSGMGTSCSAIVIEDRRLYLAHAGNSRAYLLRDGRLHQLTIDHTWAEEAIRAGRSPAEIRTHPMRGVVTRYLGMSGSVNADTRYRALSGELVQTLDGGPLSLEAGDALMLCGDGVSGVLDVRKIAESLTYPDCQAAADVLVSSALKAGASENVTAVVLRLPGAVAVAPSQFAGVEKKRSMLLAVLGVVALLVVIGAMVASALSLGRTPPVGSPSTKVAGLGATSVVPAAVLPTVDPPATEVRVATRPPATEGAAEAVAAATFPVVTATMPTSPTTASSTRIATSTRTEEPTRTPTLSPTSTPSPTVPPSSTPTPTLTGSAEPTATRPAASPSPTQAVSTSLGVALLRPADGDTVVGDVEFTWKDEPGFSLGPDEQYELIVWGVDGDPMRDGRSPVGAGITPSARTNLTGVDSALGLTGGKTYLWGIRLLTAGKPNRMVSGGRKFVYEQQGSPGGSNGGAACTGPDCGIH